jgi:hypothetical protein
MMYHWHRTQTAAAQRLRTVLFISTMTSRIRPVTVGEDEEESLQSIDSEATEGQPVAAVKTINKVMESFAQELDVITRSMEEGPDLQEMIERAKSRAEQSYLGAYYATANNKDPYVSKSRHVEEYRDTPNGRRREGTPQSSRRTATTPSEPQPVRTPQQYQIQSPAPNGFRTRLEGGVDPARENYESRSTRTSNNRVEVNDTGGDNPPPLSSVKSILDSMGDTMERQESRIRFLEEENEALRAEIFYHKRDQRPAASARSPVPEPWEQNSAPPPRSRPTTSSARSPVPEPWEQNSAPPSTSRPNSSVRSPVREPWGQDSAPPPRSRPTSTARSPVPEPWEQNSAPPPRSRPTSTARSSPMPEPWEQDSAPPLRNPGPGPHNSYHHQSNGESRHPSPPSRSARPEQWDHQTAPPTRSSGPETYDRQREFTSPQPATYRRAEEQQDVGRRRTFSPGTKFVAELSNVMKLEEGIHAPLSVIMDKHWDRIDQIRNGHGWDRS